MQTTLAITPRPAPRPRFSKYGTYNTAEYTQYKHALGLMLKQCKFYSEKPLRLTLVFHMPIPKSLSKKKQNALDGTAHFKKPDLDNLVKAFKDGANGVLYKDDSCVFDLTAKKIYSFSPRVEVTIKEKLN